MSYILDALKKAEAEQDPNARAALAITEQHSQRHRLLLYGLITALLVNAVVLVYLFAPGPWQLPAGGREAGAMPAVQPGARTPAVSPGSAEPAAAAGAIETAAQRLAPPAPEEAPVPTAPADTEPLSVSLANLPPASRSRFPELSFSTHLYASDADLRAVVVNGQRLTEGERLGTLTLDRITEDGVVFRFENYLVSVSVLDDWD